MGAYVLYLYVYVSYLWWYERTRTLSPDQRTAFERCTNPNWRGCTCADARRRLTDWSVAARSNQRFERTFQWAIESIRSSDPNWFHSPVWLL